MSENLLVNPDFEGEFASYQGINEVKAPAGWIPYWLDGDPPQEQSQGPLARYEMTPMLAAQFPNRVKSGAKSVRWFTQWKVHQGGLWQRVEVTVGQWYRFSVWVQAWCTESDDPNVSDKEMYGSLGIDPDGQDWARRRGIVWTPWNFISGAWLKIVTEPVKARAVDLTCYIETWNKYRVKHSDAYADAACLELVEMGGVCPPCPTPEPTPGQTCNGATLDEIRDLLESMRWGTVP